jgi:hypothetical protein
VSPRESRGEAAARGFQALSGVPCSRASKARESPSQQALHAIPAFLGAKMNWYATLKQYPVLRSCGVVQYTPIRHRREQSSLS